MLYENDCKLKLFFSHHFAMSKWFCAHTRHVIIFSIFRKMSMFFIFIFISKVYQVCCMSKLIFNKISYLFFWMILKANGEEDVFEKILFTSLARFKASRLKLHLGFLSGNLLFYRPYSKSTYFIVTKCNGCVVCSTAFYFHIFCVSFCHHKPQMLAMFDFQFVLNTFFSLLLGIAFLTEIRWLNNEANEHMKWTRTRTYCFIMLLAQAFFNVHL